MVTKIPLSQQGKHKGKHEALVDDCDADLAEFRWNFYPQNNGIYAFRRVKNGNGEWKSQKLARVILERMLNKSLTRDECVDHINGNTLDERRSNLRLATYSENNANRRMRSDNTSGYKGVSWYKRLEKWRTQIKKDGRVYTLGYFDTPQEAHEAYCQAAKKIFGEFANDGTGK